MAMLTLLQFTFFLAMLSSFVEAETQMVNSRKMDETAPDLENKCGNCPCDNPCNPPSSPPPPPSPPPPSNNCPPPPRPPSPPSSQKPPNASPYIYINGPPGSVYSVYPYYSGVDRSFSIRIIPFLISSVLWVLTV